MQRCSGICLIVLAVGGVLVGGGGSAVAAPAEAPAAGGAVVSVEGTAPLAAGVLGENALIHPNRDYTFVNVPEFLRGWAFTSHRHKGPARMTCRVKSAGRVYVCVQKPVTPNQLRLPGAWAPVGKIDTVIRGRSYPWSIFAADIAAGATLTVPSADRWGVVVAVGEIDGLKAAPALPAPAKRGQTPAVTATNEYGLLAADIRNRKWFGRVAPQAFDEAALIDPSDRDPLDVVLRRTAALLGNLTGGKNAPDLAAEAGELKALRAAATDTPPTDAAGRRALLDKACKLRRRIALSNPLLNFGKLLFITRKDPGGPFHMCDQFYGCNARPGGGLYVLSDVFGERPTAVNLLEDSVVQAGRLKGQKLVGGSFLSPELSFDGKTILFAWTQAKAKKTYTWGPEISYHIFKCNVDGSGLVQLTDGDADDFDPCFLPNGRVALISLRRGGYLRCGRHCPVYTMFSMTPDGGDIIPLSYHETHEWQPSVDNDGMLVYTRWDYIDRDTNVAHHIWTAYPDGRDPRSYHGNYPVDRSTRPWMEMEIRAIPGSHRYVAVAGAHHGNSIGSLVVIDQRIEDDNAMSQLKRLTPEAPFPESEGPPRANMRYGTPWPLSEDYYLCVYDSSARNRGIHLIDRFGNRELLYRDASIPCLSPIPLRPRPTPPMIPPQTTAPPVGEADGDGYGAVALMNVYDSDFTWPADTKITHLRIIQVLPKSTPPPNKPRIGAGNQTNARAVLGTVPVEADGSCHFRMPAGKCVYFQALDANGLAVQSMRSATYIQPGRVLSCQGCHEPKHSGPPAGSAVPLAMRRAASGIQPECEGANPFNYARLVQPVLDRHCVDCHRKEKALDLSSTPTKRGFTASYDNLAAKYGSFYDVSNGSIKSRARGGSRSMPGKFGARAAKLTGYLTGQHHGVKLSAAEIRRLTLWLDCNSEFLGAYENAEAQVRGEIVKPTLE